ncbi:MFS transporter [Methylobacterium sp. WL6]|uniref:MFS transporter n=1 Tax=Methylobacterium sp. WL6 TaxID=2603901 RepID=UPI0011C8D31F|nr:MFS transporter [Methylobacterium sp. WL6]TXN70037.1 MFS transporter [Methylobacterium sp. WL6]
MLLLASTQLFAFSDRFLITVIATPLKHDLMLSDAEIGLLQGSAFALLYAGALPGFGAIADRGHRRLVLLASLVTWTIATIACGLSGSFAALFASRLLLGLGQSGITPAALSLLAVRIERAQLGRGISLLTAGGTLGRSLAFLVGGATLGWLSGRAGIAIPGFGTLAPWQALFVLAALPNLVLLAFIWRIAEPSQPVVPVARPKWSRVVGWMIRRRGAYLPHAAAATAAILMGQTLTAWAPTFYVRTHGVTPAESGLVLGLVVLVTAPIGHVVGGIVLDRVRRTNPRAAPLMLGLGLLFALPATATMALAPGLGPSLAGFAALVVALGFCSPPGLAGIQFLTPVALRGRVSGVFIAFVTLVALGAGPALLGLLNDRVFGTDGIGRAFVALYAVVGSLGVVFALMAARRDSGRRRRRA